MRDGFSLIEVVIVVALVAIISALSVPSFRRMAANQRLRDSALEVTGALSYARSEAIRTGNVHLFLFQEDAQSNTLPSSPILVVDDGRPGAGDQNCEIDVGEPTRRFFLGDDVIFGRSDGSAKAPSDTGAASITDGSTFENATAGAATWVLFRPEGPPLAFSNGCATGGVGSGGGGIYLTNGVRDAAVVLTPLGATHAHVWNGSTASWSD